MNLPQDQVDVQFLREHIEQSKTYVGTMVAYCREHNLDYDKFMYHRGRLVKRRKLPSKSAGFAMVQPTVATTPSPQVLPPLTLSIAKEKSYSQMPDPKWLAELIHSLVSE